MGTMRRLPAAPILDELARRGAPDTAYGRMRRAIVRARQAGSVTWGTVDEIAVRALGMNPVELYGEDW